MILLTCFIYFALAAWPDASEGRQAALQILREDIGNGFPLLTGTERIRAYESICKMQKPYYPICSYKDWTNEQEKTDIESLVEIFVHRTEPLAQVVHAWQLGFIGGVPNSQAPNVELAQQKLSFSCHKKSYAPGCSYLGDMYLYGVGVEQNYHKALELYEEACKANDVYGCAQKGYLYLDGKGVEQNFESAFEYFSEGCSQNLTKYCVEIGQMYEKGLGRPKDSKIAMSLYQSGCNSNNANACYHLARTQKRMSEKKEQNFGMYSDLCLLGDLRACYDLGESYELGIGTPVSIEEAALTYQKSCDGDYAASCSKLGEIHLEKMNHKNISIGTKLIQKGCNGGDLHGCFLYAGILQKNRNDKKSLEMAFDYYEQGCDKDYASSCVVLGQSFDTGDYVKKNTKKALIYFEKACKNSNAESCRDLGKRYLKGERGVKKDPGKGLHFLSEGCKQQDKISCFALAKELQSRAISLDEDRLELKTMIQDYQVGLDDLEDTLQRVGD